MAVVNVHLNSYGNEAGRIPVLVELLDADMEPRRGQWLWAQDSFRFEGVLPGIWGVRAKLASGQVVGKAVTVESDSDANCELPLHLLSPHETNEWAYFTQPIRRPDAGDFRKSVFQGAWIRLWSSDSYGRWWPDGSRLEDRLQVVSRDPDGAVFNMQTGPWRQWAVQVGGPRVPSKFVCVPPNAGMSVLVRPKADDDGEGHPLDVMVSTNLAAAALMTMLNRGDMAQIRSLASTWLLLDDESVGRREVGQLDEPTAIALGYTLVRTGDDRLLAERIVPLFNRRNFPNLSFDGEIIYFWTGLARLREQGPNWDEVHTSITLLILDHMWAGALPVFADGLRLLQRALFLISEDRSNAVVRRAAESVVNSYLTAADPSAVATTFTGARPDDPSPEPVFVAPPDDGRFEYIYPDSH
jgi:hypothetical protein